jgi:HEAT repeat protein
MDLIHSNDARIVFAFWVGVCVVVLALLTLLIIIVMRQVATSAERRHIRATNFWRGVLESAMRGEPKPIPPLPRNEVSGFVDAWNELHDIPENAHNPGMQAVAQAVGLERRLYMALDHGGFHDRVMSIIALGYLGSETHIEKLVRYLDHSSPILSIVAARAVMRINPSLGVEKVIPQIVERQDWVQGQVAMMLGEAGSAAVSRDLGEATLQANDAVAPRMVRLLADISPQDAAPVIRQLLTANRDERLTSTCLQVLSERSDLHLVRQLLQHPRWHVRMQSAATLGRLGGEEDKARLIPMLADAQWWVRYRAAQALSALWSHDSAVLSGLRDAQHDPYAKDILSQVLAETRIKEGVA